MTVLDGRSYVVVGMDPAGVSPCLVYLQASETSEWLCVPAADFDRRAAPQRLRLILGGEYSS